MTTISIPDEYAQPRLVFFYIVKYTGIINEVVWLGQHTDQGSWDFFRKIEHAHRFESQAEAIKNAEIIGKPNKMGQLIKRWTCQAYLDQAGKVCVS